MLRICILRDSIQLRNSFFLITRPWRGLSVEHRCCLWSEPFVQPDEPRPPLLPCVASPPSTSTFALLLPIAASLPPPSSSLRLVVAVSPPPICAPPLAEPDALLPKVQPFAAAPPQVVWPDQLPSPSSDAPFPLDSARRGRNW